VSGDGQADSLGARRSRGKQLSCILVIDLVGDVDRIKPESIGQLDSLENLFDIVVGRKSLIVRNIHQSTGRPNSLA
jgi:hypothetical protein